MVAPCAKSARPWILAVTILGSSMAFIDSTVVNVALPAIQKTLGGTVIDMQWVVEGYGLFLSALILAGGAMGDLFGRRRMFLLGVTLFAIASAGCGLAANIRELVIARSVQGLGAAFLVPGSLSIISASFGGNERGRAIGTWSGFTAIATAGGPVLGGWLIEHASWRWAFFINVPIAAAVILLSLLRVPESKAETQGGVDWAGALIVTAALAGVTYGFIESAALGWSRSRCLGEPGCRQRALIGFRLLRGSYPLPHGSLEPLSLAKFHRRQLAYVLPLRRSRNLLFSVPLESDPGAALFRDRHRRRRPSLHPSYVLAFALVRRACRSLRPEARH